MGSPSPSLAVSSLSPFRRCSVWRPVWAQAFPGIQLSMGWSSFSLMDYFKLIRSGINIAPLLAEVDSNEQAWLIDTSRQDKIRVQRDTNTIFISSAVPRPDLPVNENQESRLIAVSESFPKALAFMTEFAQEMNCRLSRATIVRLKPKTQVFRHIDQGSYYFLRDRFHLVLRSPTGSVLMSGGETVRMQEGELWWFDNKQYHESYNDSDDWRIHYIRSEEHTSELQ